MVPLRTADARKLFRNRAVLDAGRYVFVRYRVTTKRPELAEPEQVALHLALSTSVASTEKFPFQDIQTFLDAAAKVVNVSKPENEVIEVEIAFPVELGGANEGVAQLLALACYPTEFDVYSSIWIENVELPASLLQRYSGPKLGIDGIRRLADIPSRPLVGAIVKPRTGASLQTISKNCKEALEGGLDIVVDDELIVDPTGEFAFESRVRALASAKNSATATTGQKKLYIANVSSNPSRALAYIEQGLKLGADGFMVNSFAMGIAGIQEVSDRLAAYAPLFECGIGNGLLTRPPFRTGVSDAVLAMFNRLCGCDAVCTGVSGRDLWYTPSLLTQTLRSLEEPYPNIKPALAVGAGGLDVGNMWGAMQTLGPDVLLLIGRGIWMYPNGYKRIAAAIRLFAEHVPIDCTEEAALDAIDLLCRQHSELDDALKYYKWRNSI